MSSAEAMNNDEAMPLNIIPGQGDQERTIETRSLMSRVRNEISKWRNDKTHRVLAINSIIFGISCIGIKALISSVKAKETKDPEAAQKFAKESKKFAIIAIVTLHAVVIFFLIFLALVSYLLTLKD